MRIAHDPLGRIDSFGQAPHVAAHLIDHRHHQRHALAAGYRHPVGARHRRGRQHVGQVLGLGLAQLDRGLGLRLASQVLDFCIGQCLLVGDVGLGLQRGLLQLGLDQLDRGVGLRLLRRLGLLALGDAVGNILLRRGRQRRILQQRQPGRRRQQGADHRQQLLQHRPGRLLLVRRGRRLVHDHVIAGIARLADQRHVLLLLLADDTDQPAVGEIVLDQVQQQPPLLLPIAPQAVEQRLQNRHRRLLALHVQARGLAGAGLHAQDLDIDAGDVADRGDRELHQLERGRREFRLRLLRVFR